MMAGTNTPVSRKYLQRWLMRHWCLAFVALSLTYIYYYGIQERAPGPLACLHLPLETRRQFSQPNGLLYHCLAPSKSSVFPLPGATKTSSGSGQQLESQLSKSKSSSVNGKMGKSSVVPSTGSQSSAKCIHTHQCHGRGHGQNPARKLLN